MSESNPPDDELIGQTISSRHRIISRLGAGGMATAYRAWDEEAGVPVVVKIPKKVLLEDAKFAERFLREIRLLRGLTHANIVPIVDFGEHEGMPFVAMRFLPGGSLSHRRLRESDGMVRANPPGSLHLWLPAVAAALDYVHQSGVIHRDVKPANIFFDAFWGAFLGDFGIAKIIEESDSFDRENTLTATHMGIGTQDYMAPEQFSPKPTLDGRTDQYALAVMVYEMLAGRRPFTGKTTNLVIEVMTHPVPRLDQQVRLLPKSLTDAVHRGLAKRPDERFPSCSQFSLAVLSGVSRLEDDPGIARLLCPKCSNILTLPITAAGRQGRCPKCHTEMRVADDLGALWLLDEARRQRGDKRAVETASDSGLKGVGDLGSDPSTSDEGDALKDFNPISNTTFVERATRHSRGGFLEVVAVLLGILLIRIPLSYWINGTADLLPKFLWTQPPVFPPDTQRERDLMNKVQELQAARETLQQRVTALEQQADDPSSILGVWRWFVNSAEVKGHEFLPNGLVKEEQGSWLLADPAQRRYQFVWGKQSFIDTLTLSPDGRILEGQNNAKSRIVGVRVKTNLLEESPPPRIVP